MTMIRINIHEAKTHLSRYLARLLKGETILLCKRNIPIAEIRPLPTPRDRPRPIGLARRELSVPEAFFEPLPDDLVDGFRSSGS
jgi:antitoxin (DNA-binding transcriptional repressor) of toxin-antitoxin stability system